MKTRIEGILRFLCLVMVRVVLGMSANEWRSLEGDVSLNDDGNDEDIVEMMTATQPQQSQHERKVNHRRRDEEVSKEVVVVACFTVDAGTKKQVWSSLSCPTTLRKRDGEHSLENTA